MVIAVLAAGTLPQSSRLSPKQNLDWQAEWEQSAAWFDLIGLSDVVGSWWFNLLCIALIINLLSGMWVLVRRKQAFYRGVLKPSYEIQGTGRLPEKLPCSKKTPEGSAGRQVYFQGTAGLLGAPIFHLGIAVIVLAGFWRGAMDFSDFLELSVGEVFTGHPSKYQRQKAPPTPLDAVIRLESVDIEVSGDKYVSEFRGHFSYRLGNGEVQRAAAEPNHPLQLGAFRIYPKQRFGYSAVFDRILANGAVRSLYINFAVDRAQWDKAWHGEKKKLVRFGNVPLYYQMVLNNSVPPEFDLQVNKQDRELFLGKLRPGEIADLGSYKLRFRGIEPWIGLNLTLDQSVTPIFVGFVITLLGFLLHLLILPRRLEIESNGSSWTLRAWTTRSDISFHRGLTAWHDKQLQGSL